MIIQCAKCYSNLRVDETEVYGSSVIIQCPKCQQKNKVDFQKINTKAANCKTQGTSIETLHCFNCQTALTAEATFCPECGMSTNLNSRLTTSQATGNPFASFISPVLQNIDKGNFLLKPMQWLFSVLAVGLLLSPLGTIAELSVQNVFDNASMFAFIIAIFCLFMGWIGFQIWWNRKIHLAKNIQAENEYKAIPLLSYFLQTMGEWYGAYIAIMGVGTTLATVFLTKSSSFFVGYKLSAFYLVLPDDIDYSNFIEGILLSLIGGFLIVIIFRYAAEFIRAIASIANNTKK